ANAVVNFKEDDPIDPKALWLNSQHLRTTPVTELVPYVCKELGRAGLAAPYGRERLLHTVDVLRSRYFTLRDFVTRGRAYFSDDFRIEPDALEKLDKPGARELLRPGKRVFRQSWPAVSPSRPSLQSRVWRRSCAS